MSLPYSAPLYLAKAPLTKGTLTCTCINNEGQMLGAGIYQVPRCAKIGLPQQCMAVSEGAAQCPPGYTLHGKCERTTSGRIIRMYPSLGY
jgi:hypothetical protein